MFNTKIIEELYNKLTTAHLSEEFYLNCYKKNEWFDKQNIDDSLNAICEGLLKKEIVDRFVSNYTHKDCSSKSVIIVMAGNIPFVGAADLIYALISGYGNIYVKLSSKDSVTMQWLIDSIKECKGYIEGQIESYTTQQADRVIATGSDNSGRYFRDNFGSTNSLIRTNRSSIAVVKDSCSEKQISALWKDVFLRYGLGCRNITQLFIPSGFDIERIAKIWRAIPLENKHYHNAYIQHKAILNMTSQSYVDLGYAVLREQILPYSPLTVINYCHYNSNSEIEHYISKNKEQLQCILLEGNEFGSAQFPTLFDFADNIDVMHFLLSEGVGIS